MQIFPALSWLCFEKGRVLRPLHFHVKRKWHKEKKNSLCWVLFAILDDFKIRLVGDWTYEFFDKPRIYTISECIRIQNRVSIDSPLMIACRNGDVELIRQHLVDGNGHVNDRTLCSGKTPLLVSLPKIWMLGRMLILPPQLAIEGKHLEAVKYLLNEGADPNIGNDDQM